MDQNHVCSVSEKNGALIGDETFHFSSLTTVWVAGKFSQDQMPKFGFLGNESQIFNV